MLWLSAATLSGCITLADSTNEHPIDPAAIDALVGGRTTLPDAMRILGSPLEVHGHTDATLLVYRYSERRTFQLELGISQAFRFIDVTRVTSQLLGNLSYTYERVHSDESRLVLLFDRDRVLQAVGMTLVPE